jgi:UDP:flavonoid glycosyltransferase YjiC (YdhE family)
MQLAEHLRGDYEILFASSVKYNVLLQADGYSTFPFKGFNADHVIKCSTNFDFSWLNEHDIEGVYLEQANIINHYKPHLVIGDTSVALKMAAEVTKTPFVALTNAYMTPYYIPVRRLSKSHPKAAQVDSLPPVFYKYMVRLAESYNFYKIHRAFRNVRKAHGLKEIDTYTHEIEGDLNLVCDLPELFPLRQLPPHYKIIGPLVHNIPAEDDEELNNMLTNGKPNILVTMGSSGSFEALGMLNHSIFAKYNIIIAGYTHHTLMAPHIISRPFVNMAKVLPFIQVVICHAGNGTIYQALKYGVPLLMHTNIFEQEWNEQQVVNNQLGQSLQGITTAQGLLQVIDSWVEKKGSVPLQHFSKLMTNNNSFKEALSSIRCFTLNKAVSEGKRA